MSVARVTVEYVIVWFPHDKPQRTASRRTFADAERYIDENDLAQHAPLIVEKTMKVEIDEKTMKVEIDERIVWNSSDH